MTVDDVASILGAPIVRRTGDGGAMVMCKAHNDVNGSLHINVEADKVLFRCFADCEQNSIVSAYGKTWKDFHVSTSGERNIRAAYSYTDMAFNLLHQTVRFDPKGFSQRRPCPMCRGEGCPNCKKGWIWSLEGTPTVLYKLPLLLASDPSEWIFIVEGEKDADNMEANGLLATTCPMGAGKWKAEYTLALVGRRVCLLSDNDEPGRKGVADIARQIYKVTGELKVVELPGLPYKGDVSDWFSQGHTADELRVLLELAEPYAAPFDPNEYISARDLLRLTLPEPKSAIEGLLPVGFALMAGRPKSGKSWLAVLAGICVAKGEDFLGLPVRQGHVLYIALEDSLQRVKDRLGKLLGSDSEDVWPDNFDFRLAFPIFDDDGLGELREYLVQHPDTRLVIVDTYIKVRPQRSRNSDMYAEDSAFGGKMADFARQYGISFWFIHHQNKSTAEDWIDTFSGSHGLTGSADVLMVLSRNRERGENKLEARGRDVAELDIDLEFDEGIWRQLPLNGPAQWLLDYLRRNGPTLVGDIYSAGKEFGFTGNQIKRAKQVVLKEKIHSERADPSDKNSKWMWSIQVPPLAVENGRIMARPEFDEVYQSASE